MLLVTLSLRKMNETIPIPCPYCGETQYIEPEPYEQEIKYVEDCHVCCRPIVFTILYKDSGSLVSAVKENE